MKFGIGQRVTISRPSGNEAMAGCKATVMSDQEKFRTDKGLWITGHYILIDGYGDKPFVAAASELDPILQPVFVPVRAKEKAVA